MEIGLYVGATCAARVCGKHSFFSWKGMYLYRILGLNKDATAEQIERKYHDLEIKYRMDPNLGSDFEKTRMVEFYRLL